MQQSSKVLLLLVLGHLLADLLGCVEDAKRWFVADEALLVLRVMLQCTVLTEIMFAFCDHRINKWLPAYIAGKGQGLLIIAIIILRLTITPILTTHRNAPFSGLLSLVPFLLKLPPGLVVTSVMHKLAGIAVATVPRLLVILANVGLVVKPRGEADVR